MGEVSKNNNKIGYIRKDVEFSIKCSCVLPNSRERKERERERKRGKLGEITPESRSDAAPTSPDFEKTTREVRATT